jgi:hypothetical protein
MIKAFTKVSRGRPKGQKDRINRDFMNIKYDKDW